MKTRIDKGILRKDLSGQKFGSLFVEKFIGYRSQGKNTRVAFFRCLCDCGAHKEVKGTHLSRGDTKTCGASIHKILPNNAAKVRAKFLNYKRHAEGRGYEWTISYPFFNSLVLMRCDYCGKEAKPFNGLDRVDNDRGYIEENVVPCCKQCNQAKSDFHLEEFLNWVERVYERKNLG